MASRPLAKEDYPALVHVLNAAGKNGAAVGSFSPPDSPDEIRYPDEMETDVSDALASADYTQAVIGSAKLDKRGEIETVYSAKREEGFVAQIGGQAATFQMRQNTEDLSKKSISLDEYRRQVADGNGAVQGATLRCAANINHSMTYTDAVSLLESMLAYGASLDRNRWALKDQVTTAADAAAVRAIDANSGWPPNGV